MDSFDRQWQRWFPEDRGEKPVLSIMPGRTASRLLLILAGAIILFITLNVLKGIYTEWLWFDSTGYGSVYTTILRSKVLIFFCAAIPFCLLFLGNLVLATYLSPKSRPNIWPWAIVQRLRQVSKLSIFVVTVLLTLVFGLVARNNWEVILQFLNGQHFGVTDPVFNKEVAFYVFSLPFWNWLRGWLFGALTVTLLATAGIYFLSYMVQRLRFDFSQPVLAHLGGLVAAILGLFAWGYWLGIWELVFSERGVVFGASYTDMHAKLPAQWIMLAVVVIVIALILLAIWRRRFRWVLYAIGGWIVATIVFGGIYPAVVQRFQVQPSELARETPYIEYNIEFTREAFALNRIDEQPFPAEESPSAEDIAQNEMTINNIRLWDHRPLKDTYSQLQSFRAYYDFNDVDIDRYTIDGEYRQVMLSARELSTEGLPDEAQTWVNRQLQFTHGYGMALSPVNEVTTQGLPVLLVKDIPPAGDFNIERPEIYFGEKTNDYVIVKTETEEFDYPMGDDNVFGYYQGEDGISLGSFLNRLAYSWRLGDLNILISSELTLESRLMWRRNIQERISYLAPFLQLDSDPYLVVIEGRLFWIQDAYTVTDHYPYSEPVNGGINYIRNSVKAVIDAYNGSVTLYVAEPDDALIQTYQTIFPKLFTPISQMPESIRVHLRYPEDMFNIQATVYQIYHMQDVRVFYNKEDPWTVPNELYFGREQPTEPYYIIMRLPNEEEEEFLLMLPFTPENKNNTIGWLAARCDGENYGKLIAYNFPKDRLVYGPSQIENRIGQDTVITEQLALWSRGGSQVIRGNLLLIPLGDSVLYVEPVFLAAETGGLPELKRVIVAAGEQISMEATMAESLAAIFGTEIPTAEPEEETTLPTETEGTVTVDENIASLIEEAQLHYDQALQYLQAGDWAGYGEELEALETVLDQLAKLTGED